MFGRRWGSIMASSLLVGSLLVFPHSAGAEEVDQLIKDIDLVSQETSAQNEAVKQLEIDIEAREATIAEVQERAGEFRAAAETASQNVEAYRSEINRIAQAKYRGTVTDPLSIAVSAEDPQNVIDRMSYLSTLTKSTSDVVESLNAETKKSADAVYQANRTKAEAEFQLGQLKVRQAELEAEREQLDARKTEIRDRVDALTAEERELWTAKNGPLEVDLTELLGISSKTSGAVEAALSKLGSPYGWGAIGPNEFDCSGLIYWAYQQMGKTLPRTSQAQMAGGTPVSRDELQPGDVIGYYPGATHVGLYIGDGKIVHASDYGIPVQVVSVDSAPFYGARRY
ncbi:cell wall-associated hydrolase [Corynebacterium suranareeae]|uniref:Cell wall-associated hydrolase n=1 Tax=Corynebacterium suranareeae TaxID=2506452 RepID=A0A160PTX6_9CORY|nr:C40 family peptidase [Corynebacterium suranareeae]BAU96521.1 cell wall-associated hydrolase [Corynebacterium suranareeae]